MGKTKFTPEQIEFIKNNYTEVGSEQCMKHCGLNYHQVQFIKSKFKLKKRAKYDSEYPISCYNVFDIDSTRAYCLGLLWTDGCVYEKQIFFTTTEPDSSYFELKMMMIGKWGVSRRKDPKHPTWKERVAFQTTNPFLAERLKQLNFNKKEEGVHLLYGEIPEHMKKYFWIGMVDGDGCFYYNEKRGVYTFSLCSSYNQNWDCFTDLLDNFKIKYKIERTNSKIGSYSKVHITGKYEVMKFGQFLYSTYDEDNIGLPRKYEKYLQILSKCRDSIPENWYQPKK